MKDIRNLSKEEQIKIIRKEGDSEIFNLRGSDLSESDLRWSDLRASNLSGSNLRWSDLRNAKINEKTLFSRIKINRSQVDIILKQMFDIEENLE